MKTILVTGASSGIGRALAVRAARAGYAVYAVGRNADALTALAAQVEEEGGMLEREICDVSDPSTAPALIGQVIDRFGRLDVLVNNAGVAGVGPLATQSDEELRVQFGTHVVGPLVLVREAFPALCASRGHVFMIGSGVARVPIGGMGAYPPAKAALRSATAILRRELAAFDVAVTYVDPGAVDTAFMTRAGMRGAPPEVLVSPETVARKILIAVATRPRVLNVAPLSAAAVALAELFPRLTELALGRMPTLLGTETGPRSVREAAPALPASEPLALARPPHPVDDAPHAELRAQERGDEPEETEITTGTSQFEAALEPLLRRMERAHLDPAFVRGLLVPDEVLDVSEVALRWAGMPNKHERALTSELFFALSEWGFLAPRADGRYRVIRAAD